MGRPHEDRTPAKKSCLAINADNHIEVSLLSATCNNPDGTSMLSDPQTSPSGGLITIRNSSFLSTGRCTRTRQIRRPRHHASLLRTKPDANRTPSQVFDTPNPPNRSIVSVKSGTTQIGSGHRSIHPLTTVRNLQTSGNAMPPHITVVIPFQPRHVN